MKPSLWRTMKLLSSLLTRVRLRSILPSLSSRILLPRTGPFTALIGSLFLQAWTWTHSWICVSFRQRMHRRMRRRLHRRLDRRLDRRLHRRLNRPILRLKVSTEGPTSGTTTEGPTDDYGFDDAQFNDDTCTSEKNRT